MVLCLTEKAVTGFRVEIAVKRCAGGMVNRFFEAEWERK